MSNVVPMRQTTQVDGTPPPFDLDAEAAVLSAVMLDPLSMPKISDFLRAEHFYADAHRRIFDAAFELASIGKPHDVVAIAAALKAKKRLSQVGGPAYLASILQATPAHLNVRHHAAIVYETWRVREAIAVSQRVTTHGYLGDTSNVQSFLDDASMAMTKIARAAIGVAAESNVETLQRIMRELEARGKSDGPKVAGMSFGFPSLDLQTGGMLPGDVIYVIALSHVGKTTFGLNTLVHTLRSGYGVQAFTTETGRDVYLKMIISCIGGVDNAVWTKRDPTQAEWARIAEAMKEIATWKHLAIDDTDPLTADQLEGVVRARAATAVQTEGKPLGLVLVDNFHCMGPGKGDGRERHVWMKENSCRIRTLANEVRVPTMVLAQRAAAAIERTTGIRPRPERGDMSYCKTAEQDADKIVYLINPPKYVGGRVAGEDSSVVHALSVKSRLTKAQDVVLQMQGEFCRFVDTAAEERQSASRKWVDKKAEAPAGTPPAAERTWSDEADEDDNPLTRGL